MLVIVLIVVARTLVGSDAHEGREVGSLGRILLIFDETLHLRLHLGHVLGGNLAQDDVRVGVVADQLGEVVVGLVATDGRGGELRIVAHNNHKSEVVFVVIRRDVILDHAGSTAGGGQRDDFRIVSGADFPVNVGLHGLHELLRGDDEDVALLSHGRATKGRVIQEMVGIKGIESAVVLRGSGNGTAAVEAHLHRHGRVNLQLLRRRVVVERENFDADAMEITELILFAHSHGAAHQIVGRLVVRVFRVGDILRIDVAVELAFGRSECEVGHFRELFAQDFRLRLAAFGHNQGESRLQQFGAALFQDGIRIR